MAGRQNENLLFGPTAARLRGRWSWSNTARGETSEAGLTKMPEVPGLYIVIDPPARRAAIIDPLGLEENRGLLLEVSNCHQSLYGRSIVPVPTTERHDMTDDELATWLYWAWRFKNSGHVTVVAGHVPDLAEIGRALPRAKIQRQFYDGGSQRDRRRAMTPVGDVIDGD